MAIDLKNFQDAVDCLIRPIVLCTFLFLTMPHLDGQELNYPNPDYRPDVWDGDWITHPGITQGEAVLLHFKRNFSLDSIPEQFIINITADNYYTLYVNGQKVCFGPQLGDIRHWRFETLDLAPFLNDGKNSVAVEVINWGYRRFYGKQSVHTALTINGFSEVAAIVDTDLGKNSWKVSKNEAWYPNIVKWRSGKRDIIGGFYANNPTDSIIGRRHPWGWEQTGYIDEKWADAIFLEQTDLNHNSNGFAWLLEPRNLPLLKQEKEYVKTVARSKNIEVSEEMLRGKTEWSIPANSKISVLLDHLEVTTGYPEMRYSGGKNAVLKLTYAENLFDKDQIKGNRNDIKEKQIIGYKDVVLADGGTGRNFISSWPRTFRFLQLDIETHEDELTIQELFNHRTTTPIPITADFNASDSIYNAIFDISRRTIEICTQDYFLSDAYYETMQYVGDTKVHAPVWQALSGNGAHTRNALLQFHQSRTADGLLLSCYPLKANFIHSTYSMIWVDMLHDYLMYSGDKEFIRQFLPGIKQTLAFFMGRLQPNGLLGAARYRYFVDWYVERKMGGGIAPNTDGSNSSVINLHLAHSLRSASKLFRFYGDGHQASIYSELSEAIKKQVKNLSYDEKRKLFAERPDKSFYDQHSNIMAILTDAVPENEQSALVERIVNDSSLAQATYYYRYYLLLALQKTKRPDLLQKTQYPWVELVKNNATTVMERFESPYKKSRSEAHPWGTAPALFYHTLLAGIRQNGMGWNNITIAPYLDDLKFISGKYPTPKGIIEYHMRRSAVDGIEIDISVPKGMQAQFIWKAKSIALSGGNTILRID